VTINSLIVYPATFLIRTIYKLSRFECSIKEKSLNVHELLLEPKIFVFWHGEQLLLLDLIGQLAKHLNINTKDNQIPLTNVLISKHRDGQLISKAASLFGHPTIEGSSSRGGIKAFLEMKEVLKKGQHVVITPDGPRGPKHTVKDGVIKLAMKTGIPIIPIRAEVNKKIQFKSWDEMLLPLPFSKIKIKVKEPLFIPNNNLEVDNWKEKLKEVLR
jgi:lysophospholipid acyltransferase (LPLAT)-like uncharacterized protein